MRNWIPKVLEQRRHGLELYLQVLRGSEFSTHGPWGCIHKNKNMITKYCTNILKVFPKLENKNMAVKKNS